MEKNDTVIVNASQYPVKYDRKLKQINKSGFGIITSAYSSLTWEMLQNLLVNNIHLRETD